MSIVNKLPDPLRKFIVDVPAGAMYPVDYGHIPGYTAEDGDDIDLFVGSTMDGECGYVAVDRGADIPREHKFYVGLTKDEVTNILEQLKPVLLQAGPFDNVAELLVRVRRYQNKE